MMSTYEVQFFNGLEEVFSTEAKGYSFTSAMLDAEAKCLLGKTLQYDRVNIVKQVVE